MDPILFRNEQGFAVLRTGLLATFYVRSSIEVAASSFQKAFHRWLEFTPPEAKKWALIGENADETKPVEPSTMKRCLAQLDPAKAAKRDGGFFEMAGPIHPGGDYGCSFNIEDGVDGKLSKCHWVEMTFPLEAGTGSEATRLANFLVSVASELPVDSGYASPALVHPYNMDIGGASKLFASLGMRHPGYDVPTDYANFLVGGRCRGAYWLTFLGPDQVAALGGIDAIRAGAASGVTVVSIGAGAMIRAGDNAEIGDVNRLDKLPLLRAVAKQIEPVTLLDQRLLEGILGKHSLPWQRRLLD